MNKNTKAGFNNPLFLIVSIIIMFVVLPFGFLLLQLFQPIGENWNHIQQYLLPEYLANTIILCASVAIFSGVLGVYLSWTLRKYQWKYKRLLQVLFVIPLAIPPYIAAYVYGGIFTPFGTLDRLLRSVNLPRIPIDVLSIQGAIIVFSVFLMPYVILTTSSFFKRLPSNIEESSTMLGKSKIQTFIHVILPMSRAAITGGVVLVALEVLNDYGLVNYFGIPTFSTAIFKAWFGLSDINAAMRLALHLMLVVIVILMVEQFTRSKGRVSQSRATSARYQHVKASMATRITFTVVSGLYVLLGVIIPVVQLMKWALMADLGRSISKILKISTNTIVLGVVVTLLVVTCGVLIGNLKRLSNSRISKVYSKLVIIGYSVPASIIAITVLAMFITIDRSFSGIYEFMNLSGLFLTTSILMLVYALTIRFMAIGFNSIDAGFSKIGKSYYESSKMLGKGEWKTFFNVDLPMLRPAIVSAMILTFVDVIKELPLTMLLRPFNFDTLSTIVYQYANDENIHQSSIYSLIIIVISIVSLLMLMRKDKEND